MNTTNNSNANNPNYMNAVLYGAETTKSLVKFSISEIKMPPLLLII
jgi:hypothetical protein